MGRKAIAVADLLDRLESHYGMQQAGFPVDPWEFLVWWHCGYPQSDARCSAGWEALKKHVGIQPAQILAASQAQLAAALKSGGMVPELRALRLHDIARRVHEEYSGDLNALFTGPLAKVRAALKRFHGIADPGADRILLFARVAPVAAVPSNCAHVLVRIVHGLERKNYGVTYRESQEVIEQEVPAQVHDRQRSYLLLKVHGQNVCKAKPKCDRCPVRSVCAYASGADRGGMRPGA